DVLYSGTVSAAMEGVLEGIPAIAMSLTSFAYKEFGPAADFAVRLITQLEKHPLALPVLLNVNVPPVPAADIKAPVVARQGVRRYFDQFEKRVDPRGKTYYWLAGEVMEEGDADLLSPPNAQPNQLEQNITAVGQQFMSDVQAIKQNHITITPLQYDLTAYTTLNFIQTWLKKLESEK
ncbi:MAG: 5'/3'-nucleotidase SurE, partial [Cyanobacteria bacterium P01_F01_bin.3]